MSTGRSAEQPRTACILMRLASEALQGSACGGVGRDSDPGLTGGGRRIARCARSPGGRIVGLIGFYSVPVDRGRCASARGASGGWVPSRQKTAGNVFGVGLML